MKAFVSESPSEVAKKSDTKAGEGASPKPFGAPAACGAPSKKNVTGT
jgi:hypothetical protein